MLRTVETSNGKIVIRDDVNKAKQAIFAEWYVRMKYWENLKVDVAKGDKMKDLKWDTPKTSRIWDLFEQGAMLKDGRPVIYCVLYYQV